MDMHYAQFRHDRFQGITWPVIVSGLWLRVGFVGASAVVIATVRAFDGGASLLATLVTVIAGVAVAALAWRQGWQTLDRADQDPAVASRATTDGTRPAYRLGSLQHD